MFTKLSFSQRLQAGLALAVVFFLIFATNRIDKRHFETVQETLNSLFQDRIMAQDYIYRLDNLIHSKAVALAEGNYVISEGRNESISQLLQQFSHTKLTSKEQMYLAQLKKNIAHLQALEGGLEAPLTSIPKERKMPLQQAIEKVETNLNSLSAIQVAESQRLTRLAQRSLDSTNLYSQIEIGFLIAIGLLIQFLIFIKPWK
jgi:hypothetical protein